MRKKSEEKFNNLINHKSNIVRDFIKYFDVNKNDIMFKEETHSLEIQLPRDSSKYSTGDKNLMFFLYQLYSFIGSEKNLLVIDDPVSSLDIINHYKIAFELVKIAERKKLLIFTHSVELINTLNSQYGDAFKYYYLEDDGKLHLQKINIKSQHNLITLSNIQKQIRCEIIQLLIEKENSDYSSLIHKLFHYTTKEFRFKSFQTSNHYLCSKISNFTKIEKTDCFVNNSRNKIVLLASLRVWLEKKLYELIPDNEEEIKLKFLNLDTISQKIGYLLPQGKKGAKKVQLPNGLTRDYLMSKKVLLNQAVHYQSQVMPFAYAINLSIKEVNNQIIELKKMFN